MSLSKLGCLSWYLPTDFRTKMSYSLLIFLTRIVHTHTVLILPWRWSQHLFRVSANRRNIAIINWSKKLFSIHKPQCILRSSERRLYFSIYICFSLFQWKKRAWHGNKSASKGNRSCSVLLSVSTRRRSSFLISSTSPPNLGFDTVLCN
jgi:hypothetical protein